MKTKSHVWNIILPKATSTYIWSWTPVLIIMMLETHVLMVVFLMSLHRQFGGTARTVKILSVPFTFRLLSQGRTQKAHGVGVLWLQQTHGSRQDRNGGGCPSYLLKGFFFVGKVSRWIFFRSTNCCIPLAGWKSSKLLKTTNDRGTISKGIDEFPA